MHTTVQPFHELPHSLLQHEEQTWLVMQCQAVPYTSSKENRRRRLMAEVMLGKVLVVSLPLTLPCASSTAPPLVLPCLVNASPQRMETIPWGLCKWTVQVPERAGKQPCMRAERGLCLAAGTCHRKMPQLWEQTAVTRHVCRLAERSKPVVTWWLCVKLKTEQL